MRAVVYNGIGDVTVEEREKPTIGPKDVLVRNIRCGICGTDVSAYTKGGDALGIFPGGLIGHEFVSQIEEVGAEVTDPRIKVGARVFVNASTSKRGDDGRSKLEITDSAGGLTQYITVEDAEIGYNLHLLADNVSWDAAVVTEPFSVANHAANLANPAPGSNAIVFGAGPVGLGLLCVLKAKGVANVIVSDIVPEKLEIVEKLGGIPVNGMETDLVEFAKERFGVAVNFCDEERIDADTWFDSAGVPTATATYVQAGKAYSRMALVGLPPTDFSANQTAFVLSELTLIGSTAYNNDDIAEVVQYLADEKFDPIPVITHHFGQEDVVEGFNTLLNKKNETIKVVIDVDPNA